MPKTLLAILIGVATADLAAQPFDPLPAALSGKWVYVVPGARTFVDNLSMTFDGDGKQGIVTGRLTHRGVSCGALGEPFTGTWNGSELRIESRLRPNVNTTRANATCPDKIVYTLKRGGKGFEGEAMMDNMSAPAQVSLAP